MAKTTTDARSHAEFDAWLGNKSSRKVSHNTYAERHGDDIGIRLHATTIITYHPDGSVTFNSGGWRTVTTKDRLNNVGPRWLGVQSADGVWLVLSHSLDWVDDGGWNEEYTEYTAPSRPYWSYLSDFYDGMRMSPDGMVTEQVTNSGYEMREIKKKIRKYVALYTNERVTEIVEKARENGVAGDCWGCSMVDAEGNTVMGTQHLLDHLDEGYTMASTMVNALKHCGYRQTQLGVLIVHGDLVRRCMRRYLVETLTDSHGARPTGRGGPTMHWAGR